MFLEFNIDFLRFTGISPMEIACFKRVDFKHTILFTLSLYNLYGHMCFIHHHVSGLEFNDFRETEWIRQILNIRYDLVHAICTILSASILKVNGFSLKFGHIKWKIGPIRVTNLKAYELYFILKGLLNIFNECFF